MIPSPDGTGEGREQERVNTEQKSGGRARWLMPLALALPFVAAVIFAAVRFGPRLVELLNVAIKGTVVS